MNHSKSYLIVRGLVRSVLAFSFLLGLLVLIAHIEGMSF